MQLTIKSKNHGAVEFICGSYYINVRFNGVAWRQICQGGNLLGSTIGFDGDSQAEFEAICRRWWRGYLSNHRKTIAKIEALKVDAYDPLFPFNRLFQAEINDLMRTLYPKPDPVIQAEEEKENEIAIEMTFDEFWGVV